MLFAQQAEINKMFLSYSTELDNVKNKLNSLVANNVGKKVNVDSVISNNVNNTLPPVNQNAPGILWADVVSSPTLDEAFTLVKRHNKRPQISSDKNFDKDDQESTMFRVCIDSSDVGKMKDPDIMLKNIIVREWRFNQTKPDANTLNRK
ncbi:hypothetical protein HELRODRAFT_175914 [Helobdella robusta]|uniref:Uncharacterized protein n=1 Tax=Helobdella robusta TaxID=6412 RepID=T1F9V7_HELRO|nr:hypothetical protein HELRODRAFT_175914 [Helobdella robusta]ESO00473.1 hypothetical protein HELRODRAFT_175914 [Helobdella robusta]